MARYIIDIYRRRDVRRDAYLPDQIRTIDTTFVDSVRVQRLLKSIKREREEDEQILLAAIELQDGSTKGIAEAAKVGVRDVYRFRCRLRRP